VRAGKGGERRVLLRNAGSSTHFKCVCWRDSYYGRCLKAIAGSRCDNSRMQDIIPALTDALNNGEAYTEFLRTIVSRRYVQQGRCVQNDVLPLLLRTRPCVSLTSLIKPQRTNAIYRSPPRCGQKWKTQLRGGCTPSSNSRSNHLDVQFEDETWVEFAI